MKHNISYAEVFGLPQHRAEEQEPIAPGAVVRTGRNRWPKYRVIAVEGDKAWIRGETYGRDHVVPLRRLRRVPTTELPPD